MASHPTIVAPNPTTPKVGVVMTDARDENEVDRLHHLDAVRRFRTALPVGMVIWGLGTAFDFVSYGLVGPFWVVPWALCRVLPWLMLLVAWGVLRRPDISPRALRAIDMTIYTSGSIAVAGMALLGWGIYGPYEAAAVSIMLMRLGTSAEPWQKSIVSYGVIAIVFPLMAATAAVVSPEIRTQFVDLQKLSIFVVYTGFGLLTGGLAAWLSHVFWNLRRELVAAKNVGRYVLKKRIGEGGMAELWTATHRSLKKDVALKIMKPRSAPKATDRQRFEREARATADLSHPHTVRIYDYGLTEEGHYYYAMELLEGRDLGQLVRTEGPQPATRAARLVQQASSALAEAHEAGIIHRDIKPANLFLTRQKDGSDFVKVLDFGVARSLRDAEAELTQIGHLVGTPGYIAPEVIAGEVADSRSDVYSLGLVLYTLISGHSAFRQSDVEARLVAQMNATAVPRSAALDSLDSDLERIFLRSTNTDPAERYPHAGALAEALREWLATAESSTG